MTRKSRLQKEKGEKIGFLLPPFFLLQREELSISFRGEKAPLGATKRGERERKKIAESRGRKRR